MAKISDNNITSLSQDWGKDPKNGLPFSGKAVQEFIKGMFNKKAGIFHYDTDNNRYMVFADEDSRDEYLADPEKTSLILGVFDAPFNYAAEITLLSQKYTAVQKGTPNNFIDFMFDIKNKQGESVGEDVTCVYTITKGSVTQEVFQKYRYGTSVHFKVDDYLGDGTTTIVIRITGQTTLASTSIVVTFQVIDIRLTDNFDISIPRYGNESAQLEVVYTIEGLGAKTMEWYLDGAQLEYVKDEDEVLEASSSRTKYISTHGLSKGRHYLQFRAYTVINGERFYSNTYYRDFVVAYEASSDLVLLTAATLNSGTVITDGNLILTDIQQYANYQLRIAAYNTDAASTEVEVFLGATKQGSVNVQVNEEVLFNFKPVISGNTTVILKAGDVSYSISAIVQKTSTSLVEIKNGLFLDFSAEGKTNSSVDKDSWSYGDYTATFSNFQWAQNSGWNGNRLVMTQDCSLSISGAPMSGNFTETGATLEFEFSTRNVLDDDVVICDLTGTNGAGIKITASEATLSSSGGVRVSTKYKSEENIRITFVINKASGVTEKQLAYIYVNGVRSGATNFSASDSFSSSAPFVIRSSANAGVELKHLRFYNVALTADQVLNNFALYRDTADDMISVHDRNNIYTEGTLDISPDALMNTLPVMIVTGDVPVLEDTTDKNLEIVVDVEYTNMQDPTRSFTLKNAIMRPQGTSSMSYPKKNFRLYTQRRSDTILYDYEGNIVESRLYSFKEGAQPVKCWCMKADYAESSSTHNTGIARLWNDVMKNALIDNDFKCRTDAQTKAIVNGYQYDVRTTVDGFPIVMFYRRTANDSLIFLGKYNFNNDKSTESVFGFKDIPGFDNSRMQCWEVLNNGHHLALFQDVNSFDSEWSDAFEARYPDGSTNTSDLKAFATWVASTKGNSTKFANEKSAHLDIYKIAAYYVYFMRFGAVDQTVKNAMLTSEDGVHFYYINYDNDTINGLRNDGLLLYPPTMDRQTLDPSYSTEVYCYAGHDSVLWNNLEADSEFMELVSKVDNALYSAGLSYANVIKMFDKEQSEKWCERVYNQDSQYKYVGPYINNGINNLFMLQGSRSSHRKWWLSRRFNYIDSMFVSGEYKANIFEIKVANAPIGVEFSITAGYPMTYGYGVNNVVAEKGVQLGVGESHTFSTKQVLNVGDPLRIYTAVNLQEVDIHNFIQYMSTVNMDKVYSEQLGTKLKKLVLGVDVSSDTRRNTALYEISGLSSAKNLEYLDISGYEGLKSLDLSMFNNFKTLKAKQSGLTSVSFAPNSLLETAELPASLLAIRLENLPISRSGLTFENIGNLATLDIRYCPNLVNDLDFIWTDWLMNNTSETSDITLRVYGFEWTTLTYEQLHDTLGAIYTNGTLDLRGTIVFDSLTEEQVGSLIEIFGAKVFTKGNPFYIKVNREMLLLSGTGDYQDGVHYLREGTSARYTPLYIGDKEVTLSLRLISPEPAYNVFHADTGILETFPNDSENDTINRMSVIAESASGAKTATFTIHVWALTYPGFSGWGKPSKFTASSRTLTLNSFHPTTWTGNPTFTWELGGAAYDKGLIGIESQSNTHCTISILGDVPGDQPFTIKCRVLRETGSVYDEELWDCTLGSTVDAAVTADTNPEVMAICYAQGWAAKAEYMTTAEAARVTDIGTAFSGSNITHFEEFAKFTGLMAIPNYAFQNCSSLTTIDLGSSITSIGGGAFANSGLTSIKIPYNVESMNATSEDVGCFQGCTSLISATFVQKNDATKVTTLGPHCFEGCTSLQKVTSLVSITTLRSCAFKDCRSFNFSENSIELANCSYIDSRAFEGCTGLTRVYFGPGLRSIDSSSFSGCTKLATISIDTMNTKNITLGSDVFGNSSSTYTGSQSGTANKLYIPADYASNYTGGQWDDPLCNSAKCNFTKVLVSSGPSFN